MNARSPDRLSVLALAGGALALGACQIVEETGRSQITLPDSIMTPLGAVSYAEETSKHPVLTDTAAARMVQRTGERIAAASGRDYEWEFKLLDAPDTVNAFCLPGGKIAVYTGILPFTRTEDGLAAVMGHEVAHATSRHGGERMVHEVGFQAAMILAEAAIDGWTETSAESKGEIMAAFGLGAQYGVLLPFSRSHESEADEIGLRFLVRAGYDPNEAPKLWDRMAAASPNRRPEFMSTHPDPAARAERLRQMIPRIVAEESGR